MKALSHQYLCSFHEKKKCKHHTSLVMEYCPGKDLKTIMQSQNGGGGLPEDLVRKILHQIVTGIDYMHGQGYVHRDLKLGNIMLTDRHVVKIIDFGMATKLSDIKSSERGDNMFGTRSYMAPEIFMDAVHNARKVDVWSIGAVFYTMLTGRQPFKYDSSRDSLPEFERKVIKGQYRDVDNISQETLSLLRSLLTVNPYNRPTTQELLAHPYFQ